MTSQVVQATDLKDFFHSTLTEALHQQSVQAKEETIAYLINMLVGFSRSDCLYEWNSEQGYTLRPLAELFLEAAQAENTEQRHQALQRLGDVSLFISGLFSESLARKVVDIDYYISMGGTAYAWLSEVSENSIRGRATRGIFEELSERFVDFVDVLQGVNGPASNTHTDVLQLYEVWMRTGSKSAAGKLRKLGIHVISANTHSTTH